MKKVFLFVCLFACSLSFAQSYHDLEQFHQDTSILHEIESSQEVSLEKSAESQETEDSSASEQGD